MSKYHRAFKLKLAKLAQHESSRELGRKFGVSSGQIRYWSLVFQIHGVESFRHEGHPYSSHFKLNAVKSMQANKWSLAYCCAYFDLSSPGILFQWRSLYSREGTLRLTSRKKGKSNMNHSSTTPTPSEQMTEKELREELEYLRAENAVLKKLEALAQAKKKKAKKRL
ncbi:transcriptional regulator [Marinomonas pontica]|uniref:Transcriptional regulator n=1 Tax=Marinomonas pontica TaxID=264739 RepID=A0ABN6WQU4_9GAMM|nr:transcriptional regulator [Marinomonas pontica]BDX04144.1 transcriptional regulator [Marinomonas pontica]